MAIKYISKYTFCGFKIKRYFIHNKTDKIISTCFFRPETDRNFKFDEYIESLNLFINNFNVIYVDYKLRIYIDTSIFSKTYPEERKKSKAIIKKIVNTKNVQLAIFKHKSFFNNDKTQKNIFYHPKLFGTISRFIPLFDDSDSSLVCVRDIDYFISMYDYNPVKKYLDNDDPIKNYDCIVYYSLSKISSHVAVPYDTIPTKDTTLPYAGITSFRRKVPSHILETIIADSINFAQPLKDAYFKINDIRKQQGKKENYLFDYGYDEIILHEYVQPYVTKHFNVKYIKLLKEKSFFIRKYLGFSFVYKYGLRLRKILSKNTKVINKKYFKKFYKLIFSGPLKKYNYKYDDNIDPFNILINVGNFVEENDNLFRDILNNIKKYLPKYKDLFNLTDEGISFILYLADEYLDFDIDNDIYINMFFKEYFDKFGPIFYNRSN